MRYPIIISYFVIGFLLQGTLLNKIAILGVTPNLILCLVITISFFLDDSHIGPIFGIIFGILMDTCYGEYTGVSAIILFGIGVLVAKLPKIINRETPLTIIVVAAGSSLAYGLIYWLIMAILGNSYPFLDMILGQLPISIVYNSFIVLILYLTFPRKRVKHKRRAIYFQ